MNLKPFSELPQSVFNLIGYRLRFQELLNLAMTCSDINIRVQKCFIAIAKYKYCYQELAKDNEAPTLEEKKIILNKEFLSLGKWMKAIKVSFQYCCEAWQSEENTSFKFASKELIPSSKKYFVFDEKNVQKLLIMETFKNVFDNFELKTAFDILGHYWIYNSRKRIRKILFLTKNFPLKDGEKQLFQKEKNQALSMSILCGTDLKIIEFLLSHGADPNENKSLLDVVSNFLINPKKVDFTTGAISLLLEYGVKINQKNEKTGETALAVHCITKKNALNCVPNLKTVKFLLDKGADPNIATNDGLYPLDILLINQKNFIFNREENLKKWGTFRVFKIEDEFSACVKLLNRVTPKKLENI